MGQCKLALKSNQNYEQIALYQSFTILGNPAEIGLV